MTNDEFLTRHTEGLTRHRGAATPLHASQMRWLFVGEALCYEKLDASPCVHSVIPHAGSPFPFFRVVRGLQNPPLTTGEK